MNTDTDSITKLLESLKEEFAEAPNKYLMLAGINKSLGDSDKALSILFSELRSNPNNLSAKLIIAEIYYERWMIDEAKKYLQDIIDISPNNEKALDMLSKIYNSENDTKKALDLLYKKFIFSSNKSEILFEIDSLKNKTSTESGHFDVIKNIKSKLQDPHMQIEGADTNSEIYTETMADLYISQRYYEKAAEILQELLKKNPHDPHLKTKLALSIASKSISRKSYEVAEELD